MTQRLYTFYWPCGSRTTVHGNNKEEAIKTAEIGTPGLTAQCVIREGDDHNYVWNSSTNQWVKKSFFNIH